MKRTRNWLLVATLGAASTCSARPAPLQVLAVRFSNAAMAQAPQTEAVNLLGNAQFSRDTESWTLPGANAQTAVVDGPPNSASKALRVTTNPPAGANAWDIALRQELDNSFAADTPLKLSVWLRSPQSLPVGLHVETGGPDYVKYLTQIVTTSPDWKQYTIEGRVVKAAKSGDLTLTMHLGAGAGIIEIADVKLVDPSAKTQAVGRSNATPEMPISLLQNADFSGAFEGNWNGFKPIGATAPVIGAPFQIDAAAATTVGAKIGMRLQLQPPAGAEVFNLRFGQSLKQFIGRDEAISVRAWMRSPEKVRVLAVAEQASDPFTKFVRETVKTSPEWKEYRFVGYAPRNYAPGDSQFNFFLGMDSGTLEIANVRVEDFGQAPRTMFNPTIDFGGWNEDDSWRAPALARIEKFRKGDIEIRVVDAQGKAVPDAAVQIEQKQHFFKWGTAGPASLVLDDQSEGGQKYRANLKRLFNSFVFENDLKWGSSEKPGALDTIDRAIDWLHANGIENVRGHNIVWGSDKYLPERVRDLDKDATLAAVHQRATDIAKRMAGKVYVWDVVNEATDNTSLWEKIGWDNFANVYQWAHDADPKALLAYNDYHGFNNPESAKYKTEMERIQFLIDKKVPFDVIGEQAHISTPLVPMTTIIARLDALAKFGKRLEITEYDVGVQDDRVNGEYTRDFLTAVFSQPQVEAFLMWGFWEGAHWRAKDGGAMFRRDWTARPAAVMYEDLVWNQWRTQLKAQSDANGSIQNRAFYGTHEITIVKDGQTTKQQIELVPNGQKTWTIKLK